MKWLVGLMLALVGCDQVYGLTDRGTDAALDALPPDDLAIDTAPGVCVPVADPTGDNDADTILNQNDACPDLPDRGYNEDGDCTGDACDLCPQDATEVADTDGDQIGDPCDVSGTTSDIARMEGFGDVDEIVPLVTGWMHDSLAGTIRTTTAAGTGRYAWTNYEISPPFLIETQFRIPATSTMWTTGILFGAANNRDQTPDAYMLVISRAGAAAQVRLLHLTNGVSMSLNMDQAVTIEEVQRLRIEVTNQSLSVTLRGEQTMSQAMFNLPMVIAPQSSFGIGVMGPALVTFDYLYEVHHRTD